jgi:hypothetical protein
MLPIQQLSVTTKLRQMLPETQNLTLQAPKQHKFQTMPAVCVHAQILTVYKHAIAHTQS